MRRSILLTAFLIIISIISPLRAEIVLAKEIPDLSKLPILKPPTVKVTVTFSPSREIFTYTYSITNNPQSTGEIDSIDIDIKRMPGTDPVPRVDEYNNPKVVYIEGFREDMQDLGDSVVAVAFPSGPWNAGVAQYKAASFIFRSSPIPPGATVSGFTMVSKGLAGFRNFRAEGYVDARLFPGGDSPGWGTPEKVKEASLAFSAAEEQARFIGPTVGPIGPPEGASLSALIDLLIAQKHQARKLGWIDNDGVANSLDMKLSVARTRIATGQNAAGINVLHAFIHELQAQQGKHINDNAFALLKANTEFLIFKLESR